MAQIRAQIAHVFFIKKKKKDDTGDLIKNKNYIILEGSKQEQFEITLTDTPLRNCDASHPLLLPQPLVTHRTLSC